MNARSSDDARVQEIFSDIDELRQIVEHSGMDRETFLNPPDLTQTAVADGITYRLYRILEEAANLTDRTKGMFPDAHWDEMRGMRKCLAHDYPGTDFDTVWDVVENGLQELRDICLDYQRRRQAPPFGPRI